LVNPGVETYKQQYQKRVVKKLKKTLALGFDLAAKPADLECVA
jgi:hypothetical protein